MFPRKYFARRYFAPRYWPQGVGGSVVDNGPYTIEQQRLYTPGTIEANIWPVGTDIQLVYTPGSFKINVR